MILLIVLIHDVKTQFHVRILELLFPSSPIWFSWYFSVTINSSVAEYLVSPEQDMGDIPFPSKPINRISYDGRTNISYQTLLQREGPYTTNPIQLNQYSQSHRFCGPGCWFTLITSFLDVNRYRRVPQTGQFYPYELESSSFPYPLPASCSSSLLSGTHLTVFS